MRKVASREGRGRISLIVLFASLLILPPIALADEPAPGAGGGGEGMLSRWMGNVFGLKDKIENFAIFQELSPADVGHKPRIKPHFNFTQGFISNADLGAKHADPAWQARVAPGISVSIPSGKLYTEADYTYGWSTTQGRRTTANVNTHNISALARYDLTADTIVGVGNNFQISEVPGQSGEHFILETLTGQVRHRLGPKLTATAADSLQWYKDQADNNALNNEFLDNGVSGGLTYDATADLSVGPSFSWNIRDFENRNTKDYWQMVPNFNVSYRLGPKTRLTGNFGWAYRRFDKRGVLGSGRSESELVYGVTASHLLGRKFVWSVSYAKSLQDTFDTSFVFKDSPEATTLDNLDTDFRMLKSHRVGSSVTYHFNERNSLGGWADLSLLDGAAADDIATSGGRTAKNDEKSIEMGLKYSYRINRYISLDLLYSFGRRFTAARNNVSTDRAEYSVNKLSGGVNLTI